MISKEHILRWLMQTADVLNEQKAYLTELDSAIGDADHGTNMARGFNKVSETLPDLADKSIGTILKTTGMTLISSVGGASGPLYGTFFIRAAAAASESDALDGEQLAALLDTGLEGLLQRGRAQVGDKTMIDAWKPALAALHAQLEAGGDALSALEACVAAAEIGMKDTIPLVARKGRASYLGERSVGHQDPGATSTYFLLNTLLTVVKAGT